MVKNNRFMSLDGLKFLLFMGVFLFHAGYFPLGWGGVEFFLVITSFLLTNKILKNDHNVDVHVGKMIVKRWRRLSPLFYLLVILLTVYYFSHEYSIPEDLWSFFVYGQNFFWLFNEGATKVPACFHFWYLPLDFYLFIVWIVILKYVRRERLRVVLLSLLVFSIAYRSCCSMFISNVAFSYTMPWGLFDTFALGSLATLAMYEKKSFKTKALLSSLAGFVLLVISTVFMCKIHGTGILKSIMLFSSAEYYGHHPITIQIILVMTLFAYTAVWFCMSERKHFGVLSNAKVAKLGTMSYELYVLHFPALFFTRQYVTNNKIAVAVIAITATILLSFLWDNRNKISLNNRRI